MRGLTRQLYVLLLTAPVPIRRITADIIVALSPPTGIWPLAFRAETIRQFKRPSRDRIDTKLIKAVLGSGIRHEFRLAFRNRARRASRVKAFVHNLVHNLAINASVYHRECE